MNPKNNFSPDWFQSDYGWGLAVDMSKSWKQRILESMGNLFWSIVIGLAVVIVVIGIIHPDALIQPAIILDWLRAIL